MTKLWNLTSSRGRKVSKRRALLDPRVFPCRGASTHPIGDRGTEEEATEDAEVDEEGEEVEDEEADEAEVATTSGRRNRLRLKKEITKMMNKTLNLKRSREEWDRVIIEDEVEVAVAGVVEVAVTRGGLGYAARDRVMNQKPIRRITTVAKESEETRGTNRDAVATRADVRDVSEDVPDVPRNSKAQEMKMAAITVAIVTVAAISTMTSVVIGTATMTADTAEMVVIRAAMEMGVDEEDAGDMAATVR